jgi:cytochrome b subunit of formate dehydrogenase
MNRGSRSGLSSMLPPSPHSAPLARRSLLRVRFLLLFFALLCLPAHRVIAADELPPGSETCRECHEPGKPAGPRKSEVPPNFNAAALLASPHAGLACTDCHADLANAEFPHPAKLKKVECGGCHEDMKAQYEESLHGQAARKGDPLAPSCQSCHGTHDVLRPSDPGSPTSVMQIPALCGKCHHEGSEVQLTHSIPQDSVLENYSESIHGEGLYKKGLVVTAVCTSCHTAHDVLPHTDARSSISREKIAQTCTKCHARIETVHRKVIRGELWEKEPNRIPVCVDCHSPHKVRKVFYTQGMADRDCMRCHSRADLHSETGIAASALQVNGEELAGSRHARVACVQCHTDCSPSLLRPCTTVSEKVDCSICHTEVVDTYKTSTHGKLAAAESPDAPVCRTCHGTHGILSKTEIGSPTYPRNVPALCGQCHRVGEKAELRYQGEETKIVEKYTESIHGKGLLESGLTVTATCANCHTAHGELPAKDPASTVNPQNVAKTCSQCHRGIYELYSNSVHAPGFDHGKGAKKAAGDGKGGAALPTCSDCHTAHNIRRTDLSDFRLHIMDQCGNCHQDIAASYFETYHGKVSKLGYVKTAKCYDCHGAHDILPVWDPKSHLSRANIVQTCAQCHPGSNRRFAGYLTHATHHDPKKYPFLFYTFWGMTALLLVTLTAAGLHTAAWLPRSVQFRRELRAGEASGEAVAEGPAGAGAQTTTAGRKLYVRRFVPFYSKLHLMVIVSFFALALTGMTLKFSYTGWARVLSHFFGGFEAAGRIHRGAAVITFLYFTLHIWDLLKRKRREAGGLKKLLLSSNSMLPNRTDLREIAGSLRWFFGRGPRPAYGRWTYWEKFDYFAVFWGVAVIGLTGLILWLPEVFTRVLPGSLLNVATIIHSDEALLAVGFIFTIHFFNTHFRPEKFPIDTVIFTGRVPLEEFKLDRPREYAELVVSGQLEDRLVEAPSEQTQRFWRIFGFSALGIGLTLIALIIYAVLFAYR